MRSGRFRVLRQTISSRMRAKLRELKVELRRRLHDPVPEVGKWLRSVLQGHYRYYGVPCNNYALSQFRNQGLCPASRGFSVAPSESTS